MIGKGVRRWWRGEDITDEIRRRTQERQQHDIERGGWGLLGNGRPNAAAWPCNVCGAVAVDRNLHTRWHEHHGDPAPDWAVQPNVRT